MPAEEANGNKTQLTVRFSDVLSKATSTTNGVPQ